MSNDNCRINTMTELQTSLGTDFDNVLACLTLTRRVGEAQVLARQVHEDANTTACINDHASLAEMIGLLSIEVSKYIFT
jgi:hypothetical protein